MKSTTACLWTSFLLLVFLGQGAIKWNLMEEKVFRSKYKFIGATKNSFGFAEREEGDTYNDEFYESFFLHIFNRSRGGDDTFSCRDMSYTTLGGDDPTIYEFVPRVDDYQYPIPENTSEEHSWNSKIPHGCVGLKQGIADSSGPVFIHYAPGNGYCINTGGNNYEIPKVIYSDDVVGCGGALYAIHSEGDVLREVTMYSGDKNKTFNFNSDCRYDRNIAVGNKGFVAKSKSEPNCGVSVYLYTNDGFMEDNDSEGVEPFDISWNGELVAYRYEENGIIKGRIKRYIDGKWVPENHGLANGENITRISTVRGKNDADVGYHAVVFGTDTEAQICGYKHDGQLQCSGLFEMNGELKAFWRNSSSASEVIVFGVQNSWGNTKFSYMVFNVTGESGEFYYNKTEEGGRNFENVESWDYDGCLHIYRQGVSMETYGLDEKVISKNVGIYPHEIASSDNMVCAVGSPIGNGRPTQDYSSGSILIAVDSNGNVNDMELLPLEGYRLFAVDGICIVMGNLISDQSATERLEVGVFAVGVDIESVPKNFGDGLFESTLELDCVLDMNYMAAKAGVLVFGCMSEKDETTSLRTYDITTNKTADVLVGKEKITFPYRGMLEQRWADHPASLLSVTENGDMLVLAMEDVVITYKCTINREKFSCTQEGVIQNLGSNTYNLVAVTRDTGCLALGSMFTGNYYDEKYDTEGIDIEELDADTVRFYCFDSDSISETSELDSKKSPEMELKKNTIPGTKDGVISKWASSIQGTTYVTVLGKDNRLNVYKSPKYNEILHSFQVGPNERVGVKYPYAVLLDVITSKFSVFSLIGKGNMLPWKGTAGSRNFSATSNLVIQVGKNFNLVAVTDKDSLVTDIFYKNLTTSTLQHFEEYKNVGYINVAGNTAIISKGDVIITIIFDEATLTPRKSGTLLTAPAGTSFKDVFAGSERFYFRGVLGTLAIRDDVGINVNVNAKDDNTRGKAIGKAAQKTATATATAMRSAEEEMVLVLEAETSEAFTYIDEAIISASLSDEGNMSVINNGATTKIYGLERNGFQHIQTLPGNSHGDVVVTGNVVLATDENGVAVYTPKKKSGSDSSVPIILGTVLGVVALVAVIAIVGVVIYFKAIRGRSDGHEHVEVSSF